MILIIGIIIGALALVGLGAYWYVGRLKKTLSSSIGEELKEKMAQLPEVKRLQAEFGMRMAVIPAVRKLQSKRLSPNEFLTAFEKIPEVQKMQAEMQEKIMNLPAVKKLQEMFIGKMRH